MKNVSTFMKTKNAVLNSHPPPVSIVAHGDRYGVMSHSVDDVDVLRKAIDVLGDDLTER